MIYNLTVHYQYDPEDLEGYDEEIEASSLEEVKEHVKNLHDYSRINYYVIESEDGSAYYNSSEEEGFVDRC